MKQYPINHRIFRYSYWTQPRPDQYDEVFVAKERNLETGEIQDWMDY